LAAIPEARRLDDLKEMRDCAVRLAGYARLAENREAERQCEEIRLLAERRWGDLNKASRRAARRANQTTTAMPATRTAGGLARAAKLTAERRAEIARLAARKRWERRAAALGWPGRDHPGSR
jgi:hypothetical protein